MISSSAQLNQRLAELQRAFDASFAELPAERATDFEDLLSIVFGAEPYVVRLREVSGLYLERSITALPTAMPHLLGVSDFRGELLAVYDLAALLGYPRGEHARFLLRAACAPVAFAFDHFVGHVRLAKDRVAAPAGGQRGHARVAGTVQPLIELAALVAGLEERVAGRTSNED